MQTPLVSPDVQGYRFYVNLDGKGGSIMQHLQSSIGALLLGASGTALHDAACCKAQQSKAKQKHASNQPDQAHKSDQYVVAASRMRQGSAFYDEHPS